jgi:hypothetical protein
MMRLDLKDIGLIGLALLVITLGATAWGWRAEVKVANSKLAILNASVKQQNRDAATLLATRTRERDELQAKVDAAAAAQEKVDETAQQKIADLQRRLGSSDVRVRVAAGTCRPSSGSAQGKAARGAETGQGDATPGSGLLPAENTRRLADAVAEMETVSAAYASCRARLLHSESEL